MESKAEPNFEIIENFLIFPFIHLLFDADNQEVSIQENFDKIIWIT